jgi:hypothetical protein
MLRFVSCALALAACDPVATTSAKPEPMQAVSSTPATPVQPPAVANVTPVGWWRSDVVCLELFANGDFELAVPNATPKVMMIGKAKVDATKSGALAVELAVERIWKTRFTGPCRRTHELGEWADSYSSLGLTFEPSKTAALTLKRISDDGIELCGKECAALKRDTPVLGGKWERAGFRVNEPTGLARGDLLKLELDIDGHSSSLWAANDAASWTTPLGTTVVESLGDDRFTIAFTPRGDETGGGELLGVALAPGKALVLAAQRLAGERIEVCASEKRCATLERVFDAYDHDLR